MPWRRRTILLAVLASLCACHRPSRYDTQVEVTRASVVRRDQQGVPQTFDMELAFASCPGSQLAVLRGNAAFAACAARHPVGSRLKASLEHRWDPAGFWRFDVVSVGDCPRPVDPGDEASYALVRECEDWNVNGAKVGFECRYTPEKRLVAACPWFKRR